VGYFADVIADSRHPPPPQGPSQATDPAASAGAPAFVSVSHSIPRLSPQPDAITPAASFGAPHSAGPARVQLEPLGAVVATPHAAAAAFLTAPSAPSVLPPRASPLPLAEHWAVSAAPVASPPSLSDAVGEAGATALPFGLEPGFPLAHQDDASSAARPLAWREPPTVGTPTPPERLPRARPSGIGTASGDVLNEEVGAADAANLGGVVAVPGAAPSPITVESAAPGLVAVSAPRQPRPLARSIAGGPPSQQPATGVRVHVGQVNVIVQAPAPRPESRPSTPPNDESRRFLRSL
jgi:hypothetical protein